MRGMLKSPAATTSASGGWAATISARSVRPRAPSIASGVLSCNFGTLAPAASRTITLSTTTTPNECGSLRNVVSVAADNEPGDSLTDNTDNDTVQVACPDITVTKTAFRAAISAGDNARFDIVVTNLGPGVAYGVTLSDTLPGTGWTLTGADAADCSISATDELSCAFGDLAASASRTITLSRNSTTADCAGIPNTVTVQATNEASVDLTNNTDNDSIAVSCPDVTVLKTAVDADVTIDASDPDGVTVAFQIDVTNNGLGNAYGVTLSDTLPGTGWVLSGTDAADCSITAGTDDALSCAFGTMAALDVRTITVSRTATRPNDCGSLPNTATVAATNEPSGNTTNNSSTDTISVSCPVVAGDEEGCTPGYWKQEQHFDSWTGYSPDQELGTIFDLAAYSDYVDMELIQALRTGDDNGTTLLDQLLRHAVAALLNAASTMEYPYSTAEIVAMTNAALGSGDFEPTKDLLDTANNLGCPLN